MKKRIVDVEGYVINFPSSYHQVKELAEKMLDGMERDNVDRSDIQVVLNALFDEIKFHMNFQMKYVNNNRPKTLTECKCTFHSRINDSEIILQQNGHTHLFVKTDEREGQLICYDDVVYKFYATVTARDIKLLLDTNKDNHER
jgi:hypothetical protein